jgi:NAD(P)-dependent dehydrogenase (short-subunit alcohol dehydrogenase family)
MPVAIVTGGSKGLGRALAGELTRSGWSIVIDARDAVALEAAADVLRRSSPGAAEIVAVSGDVRDPGHRAELVAAASRLGGLDLLVNNASNLGPSPLPRLSGLGLGELREIYEVNVVAVLGLVQESLPLLSGSANARILNVSSDAGVEAYESWGGYGSSKAALDHLSAILAAEEPGLRVFAVDPGDMRTDMHQQAFPGEDISDRQLPEAVAPRLLALIDSPRPSGRYRAGDIDLAGGPA